MGTIRKQTRRKKASKTAAYHHGNLQTALLAEALAMVAQGQLPNLSLRELARRLGVSYAAPYHHFRGKADIIAAIAAQGFVRMGEEMDKQLAALPVPASPVAQLTALGVGYVLFATSHPDHYQVMFARELVALHAQEMEVPEADGCFTRLLDAVAKVRGASPDSELVYAHALVCWSAMHGLATLWNQGLVKRKYDHLAGDGEASIETLAPLVAAAVSERV